MSHASEDRKVPFIGVDRDTSRWTDRSLNRKAANASGGADISSFSWTADTTGMSCPMNCPKQLRNGPCGGVRANGNCEVEPDMPCVWVNAWEGSSQMTKGDAILNVQKPVDQSLRETSAWLRATALAAADREKAKTGEPA